ncbi:MAG: XdhC family protein [Planctomycetes bacterium]|nr:XdhC family protein [Planctomycetota bacterium]
MQRDIARAVSERLEAGRPFAVATVVATRGSVPGKVGFQMLVDPDGTSLGTVGGAGFEEKIRAACLEAIRTGVSRAVAFVLNYKQEGGLSSLCGGSAEVFVHAQGCKPHVLLFGGGHVNLEVARLCEGLDWLHSVVDDRPEYASAERFPSARRRFCLAPDAFEGRIDPAAHTHAMVAGYSHEKDVAALAWLLPRFDGRVGLIGSAMRRREFLDRLRALGVPEDRLARIECPVGLPIGAESPAEIALSIVASFLDRARRAGSEGGRPARYSAGDADPTA